MNIMIKIGKGHIFSIALLYLLLLGVFIQISASSRNNFYESSDPSIINPNIADNSITSQTFNNTGILFDSVLVFSPDAPQFERTFNLTRNIIYQITYQSYTPFIPFRTSLNLTDPYGFRYLLIQRTEDLNTNYTTYSQQYLCNENGSHKFELHIATNASTAFYLLIREYSNMSQFIREKMAIPSKIIMIDQHSESFLINPAKKQHNFYFLLQPDIEYRFAYFRGVGIPIQIANDINFTSPSVKIELFFGGHYFLLAPNFTTLPAFEVGGNFSLIKFAVWESNYAHFRISTNASILNLNYGFSVYSVAPIGNGTDDIQIEQPPQISNATNSSIPSNTTESSNLTASTNDKPNVSHTSYTSGVFDRILGTIDTSVQQYGDKIFLSAIIGIGFALFVPYVRRIRSVKTIKVEENRE